MPTITDWLMVAITAVYVIATIAICWANVNSAKATRDQLEESKRQFENANRPYMSCEYIFKNKTFCGIRFYNYGNKPAYNVTFKINSDFLDGIEYKECFGKLNEAEYLFGIGQHYDFFFSSIEYFKNHEKHPFIVEIKYSCEENDYSDSITIWFDKQLPVESVENFEDKLIKLMKEQQKELKKISSKGKE